MSAFGMGCASRHSRDDACPGAFYPLSASPRSDQYPRPALSSARRAPAHLNPLACADLFPPQRAPPCPIHARPFLVLAAPQPAPILARALSLSPCSDARPDPCARLFSSPRPCLPRSMRPPSSLPHLSLPNPSADPVRSHHAPAPGPIHAMTPFRVFPPRRAPARAVHSLVLAAPILA